MEETSSESSANQSPSSEDATAGAYTNQLWNVAESSTDQILNVTTGMFAAENATSTVMYTLLALVVLLALYFVYIVYRSIRPVYTPNNFFPAYPLLRIDLKTLEGRSRCYDEFCMHSIKRYQFERYVGFRTCWFTNTAKRRLFLIHMDLETYEALREAYFGNTDSLSANELLNKSFENLSIGDIEERLSNFFRNKQEKARSEVTLMKNK